jgi:hypothetical protein
VAEPAPESDEEVQPAPPVPNAFRIDRNETHYIISEGNTEYLRVPYTHGMFEPMFKKWVQELKNVMA